MVFSWEKHQGEATTNPTKNAGETKKYPKNQRIFNFCDSQFHVMGKK